ncbi:hypothetical protein CHARACLAT_005410 [Characodon lateralis]|uniref:Transcription factor TFIIIC triple barrel domain-containing protein n=1 Tax=Characodon lateralis TaxID=208331 RepID=A0ABU7DS83_9TELE|nr:hypothetical protein [Characodon lateralis]
MTFVKSLLIAFTPQASRCLEMEDEWEEEEQLVVVELSGIINNDFLSKCRTTCKILDIDSERPMMQVGQYVFAGDYEGWRGVPASSGGVQESWGLVHELGENGAGDQQTDRCGCRSNGDSVPVRCGEDRAEPKSEALNLPVGLQGLDNETETPGFRPQ